MCQTCRVKAGFLKPWRSVPKMPCRAWLLDRRLGGWDLADSWGSPRGESSASPSPVPPGRLGSAVGFRGQLLRGLRAVTKADAGQFRAVCAVEALMAWKGGFQAGSCTGNASIPLASCAADTRPQAPRAATAGLVSTSSSVLRISKAMHQA